VGAVLDGLGSGEVVTYGEVATEAGHPGAARAVGRLLATSGGAHPWWRVVTASGRLVPGHEVEHVRRLAAEGVGVVGGRVWARSSDGRRSMPTMSIYDHPVKSLGGDEADLHDHQDKVALVVNVASECGLTPQYEGLERLQERYEDQGFTVLGFPCNQFGEQEPGSSGEIATFCSTTYGVTFPMFEKVEVNGDHRDPLYAELTQVPDAEGSAGDIQWNFEKFLVAPGGDVVARFRPTTEPEAPEVTALIEANLPS
jgi:glutathione peroxidase